jgi:hypothetical protein
MKQYAVLFILMVCYVWITTLRETMETNTNNTVYTVYTIDDWNTHVKKRIKSAINDKSSKRYFFIGSSDDFPINRVVSYMNTLNKNSKTYIILYIGHMHSQLQKDLNKLFKTSPDIITSKALVQYDAGANSPTVNQTFTVPKLPK